MSQCQWTWTQENTLEIQGIIDETAHFNGMFEKKTGEVFVDFGKIKRINSSGIRQWAKALQQLDKRTKVTYKNCSPSIIENFSMVPEFLGLRNRVESFYADYSCSNCKNSETLLLNVKDDFDYISPDATEITEGPLKKCSQCQSTMVFEHNPESFLFFLVRVLKRTA